MATLSHFPVFHSLSSHKLSSSPIPSLTLHHRDRIICGSSIKKPRGSRKVKSNEDLCNDILEFLSVVGLPKDHVPSMKELSRHGRQDLANVVRRRGYKLIKELLATSTNTDINGSEQDEGGGNEDKLRGQDGKLKDLVEDVSLSSEDSMTKDNLSGKYIDRDLISDDKSGIFIASSANSSLQEKVAKFIKNGELDTIEGSGFDILYESVPEDETTSIESKNATEQESSTNGEKHNDLVLCGIHTAEVFDGNDTLSSQQIAHPLSENHSPRKYYYSTEELISADCNEDLDAEIRKKENKAEINRLKLMLHQKELELSQLKQEIEKEKLALSVSQTKAETEMSKAQQLILEKDSELHAAEESLSGLEEVEIQYWGDGETVEVAGSFNGWHHRIKMEPQPSSSIIDPIGSRKARLWRILLWLYPGVYEIKYIVDGHWRIDPQRESITRGTIHNNILRVDR